MGVLEIGVLRRTFETLQQQDRRLRKSLVCVFGFVDVLDNKGIRILFTVGGRDFSLAQTLCNDGFFFCGIKWPGREVDHSPPSSTNVKNSFIWIFLRSYVFTA